MIRKNVSNDSKRVIENTSPPLLLFPVSDAVGGVRFLRPVASRESRIDRRWYGGASRIRQ
jgi:hypothetical protein